MKRHSIYFILILVVFSCKDDKMKYLPGSWRAVKVQNHELDSIFSMGQAFIDTMGKGNNDSTNMRIYGFANMDSARRSMQKLHDEAVAAQDSENRATLFTFRHDGIAIISFEGTVDSNKWTLDNENNLIIETMGSANPREVLKWKILDLSKNELKLRFIENTDSAIVTFHKEEK